MDVRMMQYDDIDIEHGVCDELTYVEIRYSGVYKKANYEQYGIMIKANYEQRIYIE